MSSKFNRAYFENDAQLYKERIDFLYKEENDKRPEFFIAFNINDLFCMPLGVEVISILEVNKELSLEFFICVDSYTEENKNKLQTIAEKYKCNIRLYVMDMSIYQDFHIKVKRFSRVTYIRIVMPWIMRHYTKKYLYLDADMICVDSLNTFMQTELGDKAIGAMTYDTPDRIAFLKMKNGVYFSDGLMWISVDNWIKQEITEKVFSYQGADPNRFKGQTQDLLNIVIDGDMLPLPEEFNGIYNGARTQGGFIHYSGRVKPWEVVLDENDKLWRHYLDVSPWESMPDPMPPKKPECYHCYKKLVEIYREKGEWAKELQCLFWYSVLKIRKKL